MPEKPVQIAENTGITAITRRLLKDRPKWMSYPKIEHETGGRLNVSWLNSFANGHSNANADKVIWLYEYLTGEKLNIKTA
jgi:hypothetical protein